METYLYVVMGLAIAFGILFPLALILDMVFGWSGNGGQP